MKPTLTTLVAAVVCFGSLLSVASSQALFDDGGGGQVCRAPKPSVGGAREYKVGANTFHIPVLNYLTELLGQEFDPPISFSRETANNYMKSSSVEESLAMGYDFMVANPYAASCYESEGQAVSLATQVIVNNDAATGEFFNLTQYGATLYVLNSRTDIRTLADVKGKKIGSNRITSLATHLCYDVLLRSGVHHLQDPEQTIFFNHSNHALEALLARKIDVGCAASSILEKYIDPATGQRLDLSRIRILHPQNHTSDGISFPFAISSPLVPGYPFMAFPHVEQSVQIRVMEELLAMRDHADVAPLLLACLKNAGCLVNNTACVDECFQSLPLGSIRNCDTTPQLASMAFDALTASNLVGFTKPLQNLRLRDIQETTGFLVKDPFPQCVRMKNIVDAVTCPSGHFARSSQEIVQQCNILGLQCYNQGCICSPCVKAFEVNFFTSVVEKDKEQSEGAGSGCSKFSICGTVEQEHVLSFRAIDNKGRRNATMTGAFLVEDESEQPFTFENVNGTFQYDFIASRMKAGQKIVKIRIDKQEIPESPFRIIILKRDCAADTGDEGREPDELGRCVCQRGMMELSGKCTPLVAVIPSILGPLLLLFLVLLCFCLFRKRKVDDSVWMVRKEEILFATPPKVLGCGVFGLVLLGEFRGTQVAVKRVIPPPGMVSRGSGSSEAVQGKHGGNGGAPVAPILDESTAPFRDGVTDMAARLSAAGFAHRSNSGAVLFRQYARLKKDFIDEMRVLSRLRHPNITTLIGASLDDLDEGPLLIMEYMDLGSLYDILHDDTMVLEDELLHSILQRISTGLRFLHGSDLPLIHGDLKARNILVDSKFHAKVADFGLSHSRKIDKAVGTPFWMAPELLRGETTNTMASDVYSFGIILYEVHSRKIPYEKEDAMRVLKDVANPFVNKRPPIPSTCSSHIRSLMEDCLVGKPEQRPTFEEVDQRLKRVEVKKDTICSSSGLEGKLVLSTELMEP